MTDLAAEVAQLRAELAEMKAALGRQPAGLEPHQPPQVNPVVNPYQVRQHVPFSGDEWDPRHDQRVIDAIMSGRPDSEVSRLIQQAAQDIAARRAELVQPVSAAELESRERREAAAGQADLATWTAMRTMPPAGPSTQVSRSPSGQVSVADQGAVCCTAGHARRDPADRFCTACGGQFMDEAQLRQREELRERELAAEDAAAVARLRSLEEDAEPAKPARPKRTAKLAGAWRRSMSRSCRPRRRARGRPWTSPGGQRRTVTRSWRWHAPRRRSPT